jgi:two-component system, chemotaxis family, CheB/CheR fusion protein
VAPAAALVDEHGDLLYLHGRTGQYFEPSPGEARSPNVLRMAREGLRRPLTSALRRAPTEPSVHLLGLSVKTNGAYTPVDLTVCRVAGTAPGAWLYLVILAEGRAAAAVPGTARARGARRASAPDADAEAQLAALQEELRTKEESLQAIVEAQDTTNEELQSSNEEMQSVNEELETSKEELESVNEELATVNSELQPSVVQLSQSNNDMVNLLAGNGLGTIFVDQQLNILRFTPAAMLVMNLIPSDVGQPVGHIVTNLVGYQALAEDVKGVLDTLVPRDVEVQARAGAWYLLRIRPYRTQENVIEGAVVTFVDITELRTLRQAGRLAVVVKDARDAITVQGLDGRTLAWNPAAERMYGWTEAEALAMNVRDRIPPEDRAQALAALERLGRSGTLAPMRAPRLTRDGRRVEVAITATLLLDQAGQPYAIATTERSSPPDPGAPDA